MAELGYRKVQILNKNGTNVYDAAEEFGAIVGHIEFQTEVWIKNTEIEGWAQLYTSDEEPDKFIMLAEIEKQPLTDADMLEMGYVKVVVAYDIGANVYDSVSSENAVDHLDANTEMWVKIIDGADRAQIFNEDENAPARFINLVDIIALLKPSGMQELPTRELVIHNPAEEMEVIYYGSTIRFDAELINFQEDDVYTVQWKYSLDGEKYRNIKGANELSYEFVVDPENIEYFWKVSIVLQTPQE